MMKRVTNVLFFMCSLFLIVYSLNITDQQYQLAQLCNERTFQIFNRTSRTKTSQEAFVTTNPNAVKFGGFGNFMFTALAAHHEALILDRVMVMNNLLFSHMFEHPDPRQTWDLIPPSEFLGMKAYVKTRPVQCSKVGTVPHQQTPKQYGTNGCYGAYLTHPDARPKLAALFPFIKEDETHGIPYVELLSTMLSEWTLSRPTSKWLSIVEQYKTKTLASCHEGSKGTIDLAVQFRSWRDMNEKGQFESLGGVCFEKCAADTARETQSHLGRPICVFITSDNETSTEKLATYLNSLDPVNIRAVYAPHEVNASFWHTDATVEAARWSFDPESLQHHQSLKDWMMLSEAKRALYTSGSTFSYTARLRAGLRGMLNDRVSSPKENSTCSCDKVLSAHEINYRQRLLRE